jgi:hypothetical protein
VNGKFDEDVFEYLPIEIRVSDHIHEGHNTTREGKVGKVMHEFAGGKLHSGSKKGPVVKNRQQAIAIGLSEARKAGQKVAPKGK